MKVKSMYEKAPKTAYSIPTAPGRIKDTNEKNAAESVNGKRRSAKRM